MPWTRFFRRDRWDDERARELDAYLAIETDENLARGMSPADARDAARRKLGNVTAVRAQVARIDITVRARTAAAVRAGGQAAAATMVDSVVTSVALRNNRRF